MLYILVFLLRKELPIRGRVSKIINLQWKFQYWEGNEGSNTSWRYFEGQGIKGSVGKNLK